MLIFVYGTLKRGNLLDYALRGAEFLGESRTIDKSFRMFCNGHYPLVTIAYYGYRITGEVYNIDESLLRRLDSIEKGYTRKTFDVTCNGETIRAQIYVAPYADDLLSIQEVTSGKWQSPTVMLSPEKYFSEL